MRISDWSSDVCSSDLSSSTRRQYERRCRAVPERTRISRGGGSCKPLGAGGTLGLTAGLEQQPSQEILGDITRKPCCHFRSEEHTTELQSLMRITYAVFCLKTNNTAGPILDNNR